MTVFATTSILTDLKLQLHSIGKKSHHPDFLICFVTAPTVSMYGICIYIYHKNPPNVGKYTSPMDPMGYGIQSPYKLLFATVTACQFFDQSTHVVDTRYGAFERKLPGRCHIHPCEKPALRSLMQGELEILVDGCGGQVEKTLWD